MKQFPILIFNKTGYCKELDRCFYKGEYQPNSQDVYNGLKSYAANERIPGQPIVQKELEDMTVSELRKLGSALEVKNYANISKKKLIAAIKEAQNPQQEKQEEEAPVEVVEPVFDLEVAE